MMITLNRDKDETSDVFEAPIGEASPSLPTPQTLAERLW